MAAVMTGHVHALAVAELAIAGALVTWAPRLAAKLVPYAVLGLALFGLILAKAYHDGFSNQVFTGSCWPGAAPGARVWSCRRPGCSSSSACGCSCGCRRRAPGWSGR